MSRSNLRLDFEDLIDRRGSVIHTSPVLAVLTSPDFLKEVNFHQRIATFGKTPPGYCWADNNGRRGDAVESANLFPYFSGGYLSDSYVSSVNSELPTELEDFGRLMKQEQGSETHSEKELTDREYEEKMKLERRRRKNREAAHRCRRKKMEKIAHLEAQVKALQTENSRIQENIRRLREEADYLRTLCQQQGSCPHCVSLRNIKQGIL